MSIDKIKEEKKEQIKKQKETKIEVFSTPTCPYCTKLKNWLDEQGIPYEDYDVSSNREKAKEMLQMSGRRGVPQTKVGDQMIIGFQPGKIKEVLE